MEHFKRHSINIPSPIRKYSADKDKQNSDKKGDKSKPSPLSSPHAAAEQLHIIPRTPAKPTNQLVLSVESPPNLFIGDPEHSTGVLFSGQLTLKVITEPELEVDSITVKFIATNNYKRPVAHGCPECSETKTELHNFSVLKEPVKLKKGDHSYPVSHLFPGYLPATTHGRLGTLDYTLVARASLRNGESIMLRHPIVLSRALPPLPEKNSLRIFPPTNLTAHITMAPVIHPIGRFTVLMRLSGVVDRERDPNPDIEYRWRLRKMFWKLEERERFISPACPKHMDKVNGQTQRGIEHEEVRTIGNAENREGWKSDWDAGDIDYEFQITPKNHPRPCLDVDDAGGMSITHQLIVELVVAEEWVNKRRTQTVAPTGGARVLRFCLTVLMTERAGLGISWDEEMPPMYEDVPASPPLYCTKSRMRDAADNPLADIEHLSLSGEGDQLGAMMRPRLQAAQAGRSATVPNTPLAESPPPFSALYSIDDTGAEVSRITSRVPGTVDDSGTQQSQQQQNLVSSAPPNASIIADIEPIPSWQPGDNNEEWSTTATAAAASGGNSGAADDSTTLARDGEEAATTNATLPTLYTRNSIS